MIEDTGAYIKAFKAQDCKKGKMEPLELSLKTRWSIRRIQTPSATIDCFKHNTSPHRKIPHGAICNQAPCVVGGLTGR